MDTITLDELNQNWLNHPRQQGLQIETLTISQPEYDLSGNRGAIPVYELRAYLEVSSPVPASDRIARGVAAVEAIARPALILDARVEQLTANQSEVSMTVMLRVVGISTQPAS